MRERSANAFHVNILNTISMWNCEIKVARARNLIECSSLTFLCSVHAPTNQTHKTEKRKRKRIQRNTFNFVLNILKNWKYDRFRCGTKHTRTAYLIYIFIFRANRERAHTKTECKCKHTIHDTSALYSIPFLHILQNSRRIAFGHCHLLLPHCHSIYPKIKIQLMNSHETNSKRKYRRKLNKSINQFIAKFQTHKYIVSLYRSHAHRAQRLHQSTITYT